MAIYADPDIRGALESYMRTLDNKEAGYALAKIVKVLGQTLDDQNRRIQKLETKIKSLTAAR
jgi:hypothetical protein